MLRPRPFASTPSTPVRSPALIKNDLNGMNGLDGSEHNSKYNKPQRTTTTKKIGGILLLVSVFVVGVVVGKFGTNISWNDRTAMLTSSATSQHHVPTIRLGSGGGGGSNDGNSANNNNNIDPTSSMDAFRAVYRRSLAHHDRCHAVGLEADGLSEELKNLNNHTAHLPQFGFIQAYEEYVKKSSSGEIEDYPYQCELPPDIECEETQFTVIFMAYNPGRLKKMFDQIKKMLDGKEFKNLVAEVVIVWNGKLDVARSGLGLELVEYSKSHNLRIEYPLKAGFENDLLNRYHPRINIKTKAIMYYDDDGPFYSYQATVGGFELWKRNSNAQIGAMARKLDLGPRQLVESQSILNGPGDRFFISQCPTDSIDYNYREFANFGARMVLPSGSFLHRNYLCFLWHPIFEEIRQYVRKHPVNPDDGTVSTLVSQLAGRAPKVYPRRVNKAETDNDPSKTKSQRRRLMDGINWDGKGGEDKKMDWGRLRGDAANSLARYFGSINSGSLGWCYGTEYHVYKKGDYCNPEMAKVGMLPWLKPDHTPRDICP